MEVSIYPVITKLGVPITYMPELAKHKCYLVAVPDRCAFDYFINRALAMKFAKEHYPDHRMVLKRRTIYSTSITTIDLDKELNLTPPNDKGVKND